MLVQQIVWKGRYYPTYAGKVYNTILCSPQVFQSIRHYGLHTWCQALADVQFVFITLNNPINWNLGLCVACWARFICHREFWSLSVSHLFSSLNSSQSFAEEKHYKKICIPILALYFKNFAIPGCFPYIFIVATVFSLLFNGWFVIAACGSTAVQGSS